ncbi:transposase [Calothrix sp. NIES-3974]|nr:transposase [Calothrix sp. NIES-3974]
MSISNSYKLEFDEQTGLVKVGSGQNSGLYRVVSFCDLKTQIEYRLVTNLPFDGEAQVSNEEVMEIYRCRWGVELL